MADGDGVAGPFPGPACQRCPALEAEVERLRTQVEDLIIEKNEAEQGGRDGERDLIVAWLRDDAAILRATTGFVPLGAGKLADAIEGCVYLRVQP